MLLPALSFSFFRNYSLRTFTDFWLVFVVAIAHVMCGLALGFGVAKLNHFKSPYSQTLALTGGLMHPALPLVMLPPIISNWAVVAAESEQAKCVTGDRTQVLSNMCC